jgi:hypothetical protein
MEKRVFSVLDPRLDIRPKVEAVLKSGKNISWQQFVPNQVSNSSVNIDCSPPSREIGVCTNVMIQAKYHVTMNFVTVQAGQRPLINGYWGLRNFCYSSTVQSHQLTINNQQVSIAPVNQFNKALAHYNENWDERYTTYSTTASMLDQFQNYNDGLLSNRSPLQPSSSNSFDQTRNDTSSTGGAGSTVNGVLISNVVGNDPDSILVTFDVTVCEPLMFISPLSMGFAGYKSNVLFGVDKMTYNAQYANLNRILSINNVLSGTTRIQTAPSYGITTNLTGVTMLFNYITPRENFKIPRVLQYPYYTPVLYNTVSNQTLAPNGLTTTALVTNNIQLMGTPRRIYVFAGLPDSVCNTDVSSTLNSSTCSDTFLAMQSCTLTYNTQQFMAGASQIDLYNLAVKNGCRLSWTQWTNTMGSVLALDLSEDLGLSDNDGPGVQKTVQLSVSANFKNTNTTNSITPTLYVLVIYEGVMTIDNGSVTSSINNLTEHDVLSAVPGPISYSDLKSLTGGGFFGDLWSGFKKYALSPLLNVASTVATPFIGPAAGVIRSGVKSLTGYGITGGKGKVSKAHLLKTMREYE